MKFNAKLIVDNNEYAVVIDDRQIIDIHRIHPQSNGIKTPGAGAGRGQGGANNPSDPLTDELPKIDDVFKAKLSSVLLDNKYQRKLPKRKRGLLDMKNLWKAPTGTTSLFVQKQARKGRHYNVVLLIDVSGSMSGSPLKTASKLAVWLALHFQELDIDFTVITFGSGAEVVKPLNQPDEPNLYGNIYASQHRVGGGTDISKGLELAYKELKGQPGQSFIIGISDGETENANKARAMLYANPEIRAFGVGIGTPLRVMPENQVINDVDELKPIIIGWLQRNVRRGI